MPSRPFKPCSYPGCHELVRDDSRCEKHKKQQQRDEDSRRGTAHERGYDSRWQRYSKWYLNQPENVICVKCGKPAECVDHIKPCRGNEPEFWKPDNHQPLCISCNSKKGNKEIRY